MGRLKALPARLGGLAPRIVRPVDVHGHSPVLEPWRGWYKLAAWETLRRAAFKRDRYTCQMCRCATPRPIADHRIPHRGDHARFFDLENLQTLCKPCHDGPKQAAERRTQGGG
jgi:5-methylcytosine-specific restriction protein A